MDGEENKDLDDLSNVVDSLKNQNSQMAIDELEDFKNSFGFEEQVDQIITYIENDSIDTALLALLQLVDELEEE